MFSSLKTWASTKKMHFAYDKIKNAYKFLDTYEWIQEEPKTKEPYSPLFIMSHIYRYIYFHLNQKKPVPHCTIRFNTFSSASQVVRIEIQPSLYLKFGIDLTDERAQRVQMYPLIASSSSFQRKAFRRIEIYAKEKKKVYPLVQMSQSLFSPLVFRDDVPPFLIKQIHTFFDELVQTTEELEKHENQQENLQQMKNESKRIQAYKERMRALEKFNK